YQLRLEVLELVASDQVLLQQGRKLAQLVRDRLRCQLRGLIRIARLLSARISHSPKGLGQFYPKGVGTLLCLQEVQLGVRAANSDDRLRLCGGASHQSAYQSENQPSEEQAEQAENEESEHGAYQAQNQDQRSLFAGRLADPPGPGDLDSLAIGVRPLDNGVHQARSANHDPVTQEPELVGLALDQRHSASSATNSHSHAAH